MFKLTVDQILTSIEALNSQEKQLLISKLQTILEQSNTPSPSAGGQVMANNVDNVDVKGHGAAFNYQPIQSGRDAQVSNTFNSSGSVQEETLKALAQLSSGIDNTSSISGLLKAGAIAEVDKITAEVQKDVPDKNLIQRSISALKQGLQGVTDFAGPVATVSSLVAKAWGIPVK